MPDTHRNVASARALSLILLVLVITGAYIAYVTHKDRRPFNEVRHLLAYWVLCDMLQSEYERFRGREETGQFRLDPPWTGRSQTYNGLGAVNVRDLRDQRSAYEFEVRQRPIAARPDFVPWRILIDNEPTLEQVFAMGENIPHEVAEWNSYPVWSSLEYEKRETFIRLREYYRVFDIDVSKEEDLHLRYRDLERKVYSAAIRIPVLDLVLAPNHALFVIAGWMLVASIAMRSRLETLRNMVSPTLFEEPWLLLDAVSGMPRALAAVWLVVLGTGPAILFCCQLLVIQGMLTGGDTPEWSLFLQVVIAYAIMVFSVIGVASSIEMIGTISTQWRERLGRALVESGSS